MAIEEGKKTLIEQEVMKVYAVVDALTLIDPGDTERNTIPTLGVIIEEAVVKIVGYIGLEYPKVKEGWKVYVREWEGREEEKEVRGSYV